MGRPRFVIDSSTVVSAVLFEGSIPDRAMRLALHVGEVLASAATLEELADVLRRDQFSKYVTLEERERFLAALVDRVTLIKPDVSIQICRDPSDDKFLELAVSGQSRCIVSGDKDLLVLHPFVLEGQNIDIVSARAFVEMVERLS